MYSTGYERPAASLEPFKFCLMVCYETKKADIVLALVVKGIIPAGD
jgi:hypothetical protein